ncbi:uncharacterized protein LOC134178054 [Corticium candelabrum]|uniref:uncharacterized protein LOC134178054 n=1 Tax=Corticium candelabrum TaxID=121492 RepID=UPI002E274E43|nr:uncharacterized protein LOC134178054 [Corticium candelabrum]
MIIFCWSLVLLQPLTTTIFTSAAVQNDRQSKVLILGAGMAGIKAAEVLQSHGIDDFIILEGSNRIGGRLLSATLNSGHSVNVGPQTVNSGANWVQGTTGVRGINPVWTLAKTCNLSTVTTSFDDTLYYLKDSNVTINDSAEIVDEAWTLLEKAQEQVNQKIENGEYPASYSLRTALSEAGWHSNTSLKTAIEYLEYDFEYAEAPDDTSARTALDYSYYYSDVEEMVVDQRGFAHVIDCMAQKFLSQSDTGKYNDTRLKLNAKVKEIDYTGTTFRVTTTNNDVYVSDYVICTFSVGVLQSGDVTFRPSLPAQKLAAIKNTHMAVYTNIFLKFDRKFWSYDSHFLLYVSDVRGYYTVHINIAAYHNNDPNWNVLLITALDDLSKKVESQTENETVSEIMEILRKIYGSHIPDPIDVVIPIWFNNPLFYGSYSNLAPNFTSEDFENMGASVDGRLYFAGEATANISNGYVQSAYVTGEATSLCVIGVETNNNRLKDNCLGNLQSTSGGPSVLSLNNVLLIIITLITTHTALQ